MAHPKVLYISYDGMTDPLGQSQVIPYLIGLTKEGYEFTILSFEKSERFKKYKSAIEAVCIANGIKWVPLMYTKKPPILSTLWDIWKMYRASSKMYKQEKFSIIHCRSYISALAGLYLKRKYGARMIFDMRGFWADERIDGGIWPRDKEPYKTIYHFFKRKEKEFLENADYVITLTYAAEKEIHSWKNIDNNPIPITVIPCCADMNTFSPVRVDHTLKAQIRKDTGLKESDYIFLYLGSLGTWYMLEEMLAFFKVLQSKRNNAKLLFLTNDTREVLIHKIENAGIDKNSVVILNAPFNEVPTYISLSDSSIFFIKPAYSKKGSSPIKQGELMSMGIPVVCNAHVGDTDLIVRKYHSGVVVANLDTPGYEKALEELFTDKFDREMIIKGAGEYFSTEEGVKKYLDVYKKVLGQHS